jgi:hypothetical protein
MEDNMSIKLPYMDNALVSLGFDQIEDYNLKEDADHNPQISEWRSSSPQPTQSEIETAHAEWVTEHDAQEYARKRLAEYPSIDELVVALWEGVVEERMQAVTALEAVRQAVKTKYPK